MPDTKQILLDFSAMAGVAGAESEPVKYAAGLLEKFGKVRHTALGGVLCTVSGPKEGKPHLLLDAHIDEIGMVVTFVGDNGFLRVTNIGGIDRRALMASPVSVHTQSGRVTGVVCSTPPHLTDSASAKKNPKLDELYIDIGFSKEEAEKRVSPGDRVTLLSPSGELLGGIVSGKALDDRAGCAALLKALELLDGCDLDMGLTVLFSSMEEVGGMGAKTAAYTVNPTHAIAVDVSFAFTPDAKPEKCGILGKGPMVGFAPILAADISRELCVLAEQNDIPYQKEVMGGRTGTNADNIAVSRNGVRTGLISIPQKYMHMPVESVSVCDVENTAKLLAAYIKKLGGREV